MNVIFGGFIAISIILMMKASPDLLLTCLATSGGKAVALSASLVGIYAFWMGIIKILEKTPALSHVERAIYPVVSRIFKGENAEIRKLITMNISANMLGVGGAATPLAISAIEQMKKNAVACGSGKIANNEKGKSKKNGKEKADVNEKFTSATKSMLMLFVLNATSLQIIPTTIISLRASVGSSAPGDILLPATIASVVATLLGAWCVYVMKVDK